MLRRKQDIELKDKKLLSNILSLSVLQVLNMFLPLITFPYLTRVLGVHNFGIILFSAALMTYFQILTEYSFNLTATRDISASNGDNKKINDIFNEVFCTKIVLTIISLLMLTVIIAVVPIFRENSLIYFLSFGIIIGQTMFPVWLYQGLQRMKIITYINVISKVFFTILIFCFVHLKDDLWMVPLFTSLGFIASGIMSLIYLKRNFEIQFKRVKLEQIKKQIHIGKYIFLSELKISLFTNTNVILLGFFAGNSAVTYFSGAEKIVRALASLQTPIANAMFPFLTQEFKVNKWIAWKKVLKIVKFGSIILVLGAILLIVLSEKIIVTVYGENMEDSYIVLQVLSIIPLASFIDNMFGKQVLINVGKDNLYFRVMLIAALSNILLNIIFIPYLSYIGTAISLVITQIIIDIGMIKYSIKEIKKYQYIDIQNSHDFS